MRTFPGNDIDIDDVAFGADGYLRLFDPDTGEELARLGIGSGVVYPTGDRS